jgi:hypothetical protein
MLCWNSFKCCITSHPIATTIGLFPSSTHLQSNSDKYRVHKSTTNLKQNL